MQPLIGCALSKKKLVSESIATCRQLSREGVTAMEMGQWEQAEKLLVEAVAASPTDVDARRSLSEVLWQRGSFRDAVIHMEAAVRLDPRHAPTVVQAGEMLLNVGAVDRAMERAETALELDPMLAGAWTLRGQIHRRRGDLDLALADLQYALRFAPHDAKSLLDVAQIYYDQGRPQRSLATLHHLLDTYPPGEEPQAAIWLEGLAYSSLGRHSEAVESLKMATTRGEPPSELLFHLARSEQAAGQPAAATATLQRALALDSGHEPSRLMLAQLQTSGAPAPGGTIRR